MTIFGVANNENLIKIAFQQISLTSLSKNFYKHHTIDDVTVTFWKPNNRPLNIYTLWSTLAPEMVKIHGLLQEL